MVDDLLSLLFEVDSIRLRRYCSQLRPSIQEYPGQLVYYLDKVLDSPITSGADFYEYVYEEYEGYNALLAEGARRETCDFEWIESFPPAHWKCRRSLPTAVVRLSQVEIRKLSLSSLFGLIQVDKSLLPTVLSLPGRKREQQGAHAFAGPLVSLDRSGFGRREQTGSPRMLKFRTSTSGRP
jgi:hypothetical protein